MNNSSALNITDWLSEKGLSQYAQAFVENDIDAEILVSLTSDDLREMGVISIGHRRRILTAAAQLNEEPKVEPQVKAKTEPEISVASKPKPSPQPPMQSAERRNLTVMFCDLMDSTALSVNVDPEDYREYIASYRRVLEDAIKPFDGHVAQFLGDGIFVYFGYPRSVEHDAENAVAAGLAIVQSVANMQTFGEHKPQVRIGIATGLTVVAATNEASKLIGDSAVGETPNLAARLQAIAQANDVIVGPSTRNLIGDLFECADLGEFELKGFKQSVQAWRIDAHGSSASRFNALRSSQPTTGFIGREQEMTRLRNRLAAAQSGHGQFVVIVGESGLGKSRLAHQITKEASVESADQPILQCTPYNVGSAFHPLRKYIQQASGITFHDSDAQAIDKLSLFISGFGSVSPEKIALIAELTEIGGADTAPLLGLSSQERRNRTMVLLAGLLAMMTQNSTAIRLEDIQWIDPSTAELIEGLLPELSKLTLLVVATMRPQPHSPWLVKSSARFIELERLGRDEVIRLTRAVAGGTKISRSVMDAIIERSDGIPIFVEELTRGYTEAALEGRESADGLSQIPTSLADSLLARLDKLNVGRKLALIAAVVGFEFPVAVLIAVSGLSQVEARDGVDELLDANILVIGHSLFGEAISFRHMLMRETAYKLLLRRDRVKLHRQIFDNLTSQFPKIVEAVPHIVALHLEGAQDFKNAAQEWDRAADQAAKRSAYAEAVSQITKAIDANDRCEASQEKDERELSYRLSLTSALIASRGYSSGGVEEETERVILLSRKTGTTEKLIPALTAKWVVLGSNAHSASHELAVQMAEAAKSGSDVDKLLARRVMATTLLFGGDFLAAIEENKQFLAIYDFDLHEKGLSVVGPSNHAIVMMLGLAEAYTFLAEFKTADQWRTKAMDAANRSGNMHDICHVNLFAGCFLAALRNQNEELGLHAVNLKSLSSENNLPFWNDHADLFHGLYLIGNGQDEEGFVKARRGVKGLIASNAFNICWFVIYADACEKGGKYEEAGEYLKLVKPSQDQGEMWMAAEYHRINGRLILGQGGQRKDAKQAFKTAQKIAESQSAVLFLERVKADLTTFNISLTSSN